MTDILTIEQRRKNMQHIKSKDTAIECKLRKFLWKQGIRYRKNVTTVPGKPDIVITKYKIAVFCDGEFFHGKDWIKLKEKLILSNNGAFWINKISANIERDRLVNEQLIASGWTVIRFWGKEIKKNVDHCVRVVEEAIERSQRQV